MSIDFFRAWDAGFCWLVTAPNLSEALLLQSTAKVIASKQKLDLTEFEPKSLKPDISLP